MPLLGLLNDCKLYFFRSMQFFLFIFFDSVYYILYHDENVLGFQNFAIFSILYFDKNIPESFVSQFLS